MTEFMEKCQHIVSNVSDLLSTNNEWEQRYHNYGKAVLLNTEAILSKKEQFHEWAPLFLYMNVTQAKDSMGFSLRFLGQDVAKLTVNRNGIKLSTKDKELNKTNKRDFNCDIQLDNVDWRSKEATEFRKYFSNISERTRNSAKKNEEHRIESLLLTEFSKTDAKEKILLNIQPVKIAGIARFQMPTPLSASKVEEIKYSNSPGSGGGVDIMSRIGRGGGVKLCVMEVKDEYKSNEPPQKAILQGLAYAVFIRELLRSEGGNVWWEIFGFDGNFPKKIDLYVASVMPQKENFDTSFADMTLTKDEDIFHLHYIYFREHQNRIENFVTSLKQCSVRAENSTRSAPSG